jgi:bifunctional non-homologous end joining protein LigD
MARPSKVPKALQPMLATLIDAPFDGKDWVFESKWDGFRLVAKIEKRTVTLYSRSGLIVTDKYQPIGEGAGEGQKGRSA